MRVTIVVSILLASLTLAGGTWVDTTFVPPSLGFERGVCVYLPEGYDPYGAIDYPAIYWLHGITGNHYAHNTMFKTVLDSMIGGGTISPVILVKPDGTTSMYSGSFFANSELYGNYEDFIKTDLVDFVDASFRTIPSTDMRAISGHSMGGTGCIDIALRNHEMYRAVAAHAGNVDFTFTTDFVIPLILQESPETEPPYTYEYGNGWFTDGVITMCGAYSPNMSNPPTYIDFVLDPYGEVVDSVFALWALHDPAQLALEFPSTAELDIYTSCGTADSLWGLYQCNCSFDSILTALGIPHLFEPLEGEGHGMTFENTWAKIAFLMDCLTSVEGDPITPSSVLLETPFPNPASVSTTIEFELPEAGPVRLDTYDLSGRSVQTLVDGSMEAGEHSVAFDGSGLVSGVYLVRLQSGSRVATARVVLVR